MSTTINKYRVWCNTESAWVETWDNHEPTVCPNNIEHEINTSKTVSIDAVTQEMPFSYIDNNKIAVHSSAKPYYPGGMTYVIWAGAGDDMNIANDGIGKGEIIQFNMTPGVAVQKKRMQFNPAHGRVWIHQGYIRFEGGGMGDHIEADVVALATPLQTVANLTLVVDNHWVKYNPVSGTHGFADASKITLIPRTFEKDGDWDWDGTSLTPNMAGIGGFKISDVEKLVQRYVNKLTVRGNCYTLSPLTSHDTTELPANYVLEFTADNVSDTTWFADILVEIYRERTWVTN